MYNRNVSEKVQKLSKKGITIIMVEHKIEKIAAYSDRVILLDEGKLIDMDTPQKIFSKENLHEYGVEAPIFTKICKGLGIRNNKTLCYPVTLEEAKEVLAK